MREFGFCTIAWLMLLVGTILASCGESGVTYVTSETVKPEDLPVSPSVYVPPPDFGLDESKFRHLDIAADGVISSDGVELWREGAADETTKLVKTLGLFSKEMVWEHGVPYGSLMIRAHRDASYEVIDFLLAECLRPSIDLRLYYFAVRGLNEDDRGVVSVQSSNQSPDRVASDVDLRISVSATDGVVACSLHNRNDTQDPRVNSIVEKGAGLTDPAKVVPLAREVSRLGFGCRICPAGDVPWGAVMEIAGGVMDNGVLRVEDGYCMSHEWDGGFFFFN